MCKEKDGIKLLQERKSRINIKDNLDISLVDATTKKFKKNLIIISQYIIMMMRKVMFL